MKKVVFYLGFFIVLFGATPTFAQTYNGETSSQHEYKSSGYTSANVNLRSFPSTSAQIILVIPANTKLEILSSSGDWYSVEYQCYEGQYNVAKYGYISKKYLY